MFLIKLYRSDSYSVLFLITFYFKDRMFARAPEFVNSFCKTPIKLIWRVLWSYYVEEGGKKNTERILAIIDPKKDSF